MFENLTIFINDVLHYSLMTMLKLEDMPNYYLQGLSGTWPSCKISCFPILWDRWPQLTFTFHTP
jgi:hypothetical protein